MPCQKLGFLVTRGRTRPCYSTGLIGQNSKTFIRVCVSAALYEGKLFPKVKTETESRTRYLICRHTLEKSKQKISAYLGVNISKLRVGNSSCYDLSKK